MTISRNFSSRFLAILLISLISLDGWMFYSESNKEITVLAAYTENENDTFAEYRTKIESALQDMERDFRVNGSITDSAISSLRSLVQEAYIRLPDTPDEATKNSKMKKGIDLYLDLAAKEKSSQLRVGNAISEIGTFIHEASIKKIEGSISANPNQGNAPLTTSFLATAKDPSGVNISDNNYIWWMRENGGYRKELQRGPTLTHTFAKEGTYQVFLDVVSGSKNSKGKTDVLPLSISQDITVLPRLGNIILLVNGVNASNLDTIKVNPTLGKIGIIFDATASRAISNGSIQKTKWDFGNGNTLEYNGSPIIERQVFANEGTYNVSLEVTTNQNQSFKKDIRLIVRDPAAVINNEKDIGYIGEEFRMSAKSYLANTNNVSYSWQATDANTTGEKPIVSQEGSTFTYKFTKIGQYIVSLTARNANGSIDKDSRVITIESREPMVNLDSPKPQSSERPNTIIFDASRSFDPDTNSSKNLSYTWYIDKEKVSLDNTSKDGAIGSYTFAEKGAHSVSLTVANTYGKIKTIDKNFDVASTLTIGMNISPRAAAIGTSIGFQARSPRARFFEWNVGDGSPNINGTTDNIEHTYKKTGIYSVSLTVKNSDGTESNTIERKVYITDTNSPFALIDIKNGSNTTIEDSAACSGVGAFQINRAESTTVDGGNSINTDGNTTGLSYTWRYLGRTKTGPSFSEKFTELGCFPIELTVRSDKNGASHTSKSYIQIKNIAPKLTSIDASVDTTKKDNQKIIVNVSANGARDEDGVITSYIWYYTTESDTEPQNIRITQSPKTTFIVPNVTEKYTFGVILEDNDGTRVNSTDLISDQSPLLVANDNANINMPLISLTTPKTQILTEEPIEFNVSAKNILGMDITSKSQYQWDFDGDGKIDKKTTEPKANYAYKASGKYTMKVKVTYNGTSNTKYQLITVKNELKAGVQGYKYGNNVYLLNTSQGTYDRALWKVGERTSESLYGISVPTSSIGHDGVSLTVSAGENDTSTIEVTPTAIEEVASVTNGTIALQTYPTMSGDTLTLKSPGDKILLSAFGNDGTRYSIDTDAKIDSDLDGVGDNDTENKDTPSYTDGSAYMVSYSDSKIRNHQIKVTISKNGTTLGSRTINVILDYIIDLSKETPSDISGTGSEGFSTIDKANLEKLQAKIRTLDPSDRIVLTQDYNILIEGWNDAHDRTQGLLDIQKYINESSISGSDKTELSSIVDTILVGDAQATNEITVASQVIDGLIKKDNPNRAYLIERLEKIKAQPGNLSENKILGKEILEKVQSDSNMSNEDKLVIRSQMLVIVNGGQESVAQDAQDQVVKEAPSSSGVFGFISGVVKIFFIIILVIAILFLLGYILYRTTRKGSDIGFQDFLIDSIAHKKKNENEQIKKDATVVVAPATDRPISIDLNKEAPKVKVIDPLGTIPDDVILVKKVETPIIETPIEVKPIVEIQHEESISKIEPEHTFNDNIVVQTENVIPQVKFTEDSSNTSGGNTTIPDWLKPAVPKIIVAEETISTTPKIIVSEEVPLGASEKNYTLIKESPQTEQITPTESSSMEETMPIPDWLTEPGKEEDSGETNNTPPSGDDKQEVPEIQIPPASTELPDWLRDSVEVKSSDNITEKPKKKKSIARKAPTKEASPESLGSTPIDKSTNTQDDIPDWLK